MRLTGPVLLLALALSQSLLIAREAPRIFPRPLSPRIANYAIAVEYHPENKMLRGRQFLIWHNRSRDAIQELQFHMYLNAFRNNRSTFMKESGGVHRGFKIDEKKGWGFIEVLRMVWVPPPVSVLQRVTTLDWLPEDGLDLSDSLGYIQPDDGNPDDKTVLQVRLPRPVAPGDSVIIFIDYLAKLPEPPFARTGAWEEYVFAGQWFPKIGVYTEDGWNCHQFHRNSEFFADFGVYDVFITVPADYIVGATGIEVEVTLHEDGRATHYYHAEDVHDFAWTASPEFVVFQDRSQDVAIRLLMQPDHLGQADRHLKAIKAAVAYFQNWYGDYPYPNITVVDPRRGAKGSGGMEYPTLITAGTVYGLPEGVRAVEAVIIHEFGHQYWYHLLASNEFEESWLDEGINSYTEVQILEDLYGPRGSLIDFLGLKIGALQMQRWQYINMPDYDPVVRRAWEYYSSGSYGVNSYARPAVLLTTLQNYLGRETMLQIMRTYVQRYRFKHPTTRDFIQVANEVSGQDLSWFFQQALFTTRVLDYSVEWVVSKKIKKPKGFDYSLPVTEFLHQAGLDTVSAGTIRFAKGSEVWDPDTTLYYTEVKVRRRGMFQFPVEIEFEFTDGDTLQEFWDGRDPWKKFVFVGPNKLVRAEVDPRRQIPLDINYANNSKMVRPVSRGLNKQAGRFLFMGQFLFDQPEWLGLLQLF